MSNGAGLEADSGDVSVHPRVTLAGWRVRYKQVLKSLRSLDPSKSANGVGPRMLKACHDAVAGVITRLFKFIVNKATFVSRWEIGRVSPLHKRGAVSDETKYRPVTVLDNMSTTFEDVIEDQFYVWITKFIPDEQYGFLRGCGTKDYGATLLFNMLLSASVVAKVY